MSQRVTGQGVQKEPAREEVSYRTRGMVRGEIQGCCC